MSRSRSYYYRQYPSTISSLGEVLSTWHKSIPDKYGFVLDAADKAIMQDELSPPGLVDLFNPVSHVHYVGSRIGTDAKRKPSIIYYPSAPNRSWEFSGCVGYHNSSASVPTDQWAALINSLAGKVNGFVQPQTLLAVSLWELRKTYAMIRNPFSLLSKNWRAHAGMHPARALSKSASGVWLESTYGWKSLYYDIKGIASGLSKIATQNPHQALEGMLERWSVVSDGFCSLPTTIYPYGGSDSYWDSLIYDRTHNVWSMIDLFRVTGYRAKWTLRVGCQQRIRAVNDLRLWIQKFQTFGLDRQSILSTLWEIVPFSFVVDWFVDTQSVWSPLSMARLAAPDIRNLGCSTKLEEQYQVEYFPVFDPWKYTSPWSYASVKAGSTCDALKGTKGSTTTYVRSLGLPPLSTILTIFKSKGLNSTQLVSGSSLIIQQANNLFDALRRVKR